MPTIWERVWAVDWTVAVAGLLVVGVTLFWAFVMVVGLLMWAKSRKAAKQVEARKGRVAARLSVEDWETQRAKRETELRSRREP